ncbi:MAG: uracil-DNA glycosylase [Acidobacteriota bacterium]
MKVSNPFGPAPSRFPAGEVTRCRACPRLVRWREGAAERVPPRFAAWVECRGFWARPLPAFGDPRAVLAVVGLAPAAQGGNRTGRMFTGDRSGEFLYAALHRAGLASRPVSEAPDDGLRLRGVLITAAVRCAPPQNRPTPEEAARCRPFLRSDLASLDRVRVVLALGRFAHDAVVALVGPPDRGPRIPAFGHGAEHLLPGNVRLVDSYHVSQRNTQTGLLTTEAFDAVLRRCRELAAG